MKLEIKFPEWLDLMTCKNRMLWGHILGGGLLCKIGLWFEIPKWWTLPLVFILACIWEFIEWVYAKGDVERIYGSYRRWVFDSTGDILGAVCCCLIIIL
jgi:hypothetical protein